MKIPLIKTNPDLRFCFLSPTVQLAFSIGLPLKCIIVIPAPLLIITTQHHTSIHAQHCLGTLINEVCISTKHGQTLFLEIGSNQHAAGYKICICAKLLNGKY